MTIRTERLILRQWQPSDLPLFAQLNADLRVMEYFPAILSKQDTEEMVKRMMAKIDERGWGFWAASLLADETFIGFIGMNDIDQGAFPTHFTPAVEVGWRLAYPHWGKGYASEGALACLTYGFETLNLEEIVSFTAVQNMRSRKVMERIGMHRDAKDDFANPKLPKGHQLSQHVLYRLKQQEWRSAK